VHKWTPPPLRLELKSALDSALGLQLPATVVYDYPSISALSTYVCGELGGCGDDAVDGAAARLGSHLHPREPFVSSSRIILVTGSSARAPTRASQPAAPATGDAIQRIPRARWDMQAHMVWSHCTLASRVCPAHCNSIYGPRGAKPLFVDLSHSLDGAMMTIQCDLHACSCS
jgi:hypothetical protein